MIAMHLKTYSELTFTDDFMFCKVMTTRLDLCKELLELILGIKIREILIHESQKAIEQTYDGKGVRLDVYVEDDRETIYDIEMQTVARRNLPKRSRYYQGMIDLNHIERGDSFDKLKKTFVIFICLTDPFDRNLPLYTFENLCHEDGTLALGDEAYKVFVNAKGSRERLSPEMAALLDYLTERKTESDLTKAIQAEINTALHGGKWEVEYMTMRLKIQEEREEARAEGREEGILETMASLVKDGLIDLKTATGRLNMTDEEFWAAANAL